MTQHPPIPPPYPTRPPASVPAPQPAPVGPDRLIIPSRVHGAAFLGYALALSLSGLALQLVDAVPVAAAVLFVVAAVALVAALGVHWAAPGARTALTVLGVLATLLQLVLGFAAASSEDAGTAVTTAMFLGAAVWPGMIRCLHSGSAREYLAHRGATHQQRLADPERARVGTCPRVVWAAAGWYALLAAVGALWTCAALLAAASGVSGSDVPGEDGGVSPLAVLPLSALLLALTAAQVRGMVTGRLWARSLTVVSASLGLLAAGATLIVLADLATPAEPTLFHRAEHVDVTVPVVLTLVGAAIQAFLLFAMRGTTGAGFYARGR